MNPDKVIDSKDLKFSEKSVIYDAKRNALRILSRAEDQLEFGSFEVGVWGKTSYFYFSDLLIYTQST